jgi:hypothetical protein
VGYHRQCSVHIYDLARKWTINAYKNTFKKKSAMDQADRGCDDISYLVHVKMVPGMETELICSNSLATYDVTVTGSVLPSRTTTATKIIKFELYQ